MPATFNPGETVVYATQPDLYGEGLYLEPDEVTGLVRVLLNDGSTELFGPAELTYPDTTALR